MIMNVFKNVFLLFLLFCFSHFANAQTGLSYVSEVTSDILPSYNPSRQEVLERYQRAALLDSTTRKTVYKMSVQPYWQKDGKSFWYKNVLRDSVSEYLLVDVVKNKKNLAFDHAKLAAALSKSLGKEIESDRIKLSNLFFGSAGKMIIQIDRQFWECDLISYNCAPVNPPLPDSINSIRWTGFKPYNRWEQHYITGDSISPNKQWVSFVKGYNVYVRPMNGGEEIQLTTDGTEKLPYGALIWSPGSEYFVGYKINRKEDKKVHYILSSVSNTTRGILKSNPYAQPGDEFTSYEMFVFHPDQKLVTKVKTDKYDFLGMPRPVWRKGNNRYFTYEKADRGHQRFRIIEVDGLSGDTRNIVDEKTNTFIYESRIFTHYLERSNEIIWTSEKDGWRHIYLVDAVKGIVKPITKGPWVVRDVDSIDEKKREIWFSASGMNQGEDPYNIHYYRIGFDGRNLVNLTPATGHHHVSFSPDRKYFIDTYSQPAVAPVTELRRTTDGKLLMDLEKADVSDYLATGVPLPEVFVAKGRDDQTDIWGVVCRPGKFDPGKRYPVIENIYAGPQDAFVPKTFMTYGEMQSLAELGFIVVQIDGMGTANRSKVFHDVCWQNLADAGFPDRIRWIKALAAKYPYVDTSRVGLYGTSAGGQNALGGLLFHPEFYTAAVAACGCHDNRVDKQWWNEQWMGYPVGKHYEEQSNVTNAHKLKGNLLLIVGEADTNVPPESTYRVADALIKSGKTFDFLAVPGMGHSDGGAYGRKKKRDFFVRALLGVDPPNRNSGEL